jgi:CRISPR-associated protein Cmr2
MDGDGIGQMVDEAAKREQGHKDFSQTLSQFARDVENIVAGPGHWGHPIYNGGDDVFALAPVSTAVAIGQALQTDFKEKVNNGTASAGIAIAHHLYPLSAALQTAHEAEQTAKQVEGKSAVVVRVLKRSGETLEVRSKWTDIPLCWNTLIGYFQKEDGLLSSKFAYSVAAESRIVTGLDEKARKATLHRLIGRHTSKQLSDDETQAIKIIEDELTSWTTKLDGYIPQEKVDGQEVSQGFAELGRWLLLAHFMAQRGDD